MAAFILGFFCGAGQLALLIGLARAITGSGSRPLLWGLSQPVLPAALFFGCALLAPHLLLWAAGGFVIPLLGGSLLYFFRAMAAARRPSQGGDGG